MNQPARLETEKWNELGKLYLFPVEHPELLNQGIERQWFLTHQKSDRLFCGHINQNGLWSLCKDKDLAPTNNYQPVAQIWELLSNDNLVSGFKSAKQIKIDNEQVNPQDESNSEEEPTKLNKTQNQKTLVHQPQISLALDNTNYYLDGDEEELVADEEKAQLNQEEEYLSDLEDIEFIYPEISANVEAQLTSNQEQENEIIITERERSLLEKDLQVLLWQGYQEDLLDVANQDPDQPWLIELGKDKDSIKLVATKDQHTVISLNQDGAIAKNLSLEDADLLMNDLEKGEQNYVSVPNRNQENHQQTGWEIE